MGATAHSKCFQRRIVLAHRCGVYRSLGLVTPMSISGTREATVANAMEHELMPVSVHERDGP